MSASLKSTNWNMFGNKFKWNVQSRKIAQILSYLLVVKYFRDNWLIKEELLLVLEWSLSSFSWWRTGKFTDVKLFSNEEKKGYLLWTKDRNVWRSQNDVQMAKQHTINLGYSVAKQELLFRVSFVLIIFSVNTLTCRYCRKNLFYVREKTRIPFCLSVDWKKAPAARGIVIRHLFVSVYATDFFCQFFWKQ